MHRHALGVAVAGVRVRCERAARWLTRLSARGARLRSRRRGLPSAVRAILRHVGRSAAGVRAVCRRLCRCGDCGRGCRNFRREARIGHQDFQARNTGIDACPCTGDSAVGYDARVRMDYGPSTGELDSCARWRTPWSSRRVGHHERALSSAARCTWSSRMIEVH